MSDAEKKRDAARRTYCAACVSALSARNDAIAAEHVAYDAVIAAAWVAYHAAPDAEVTP